MSSIDWVDLAKSQKVVKTKDERSCGNLMAEYKDNIIIIEGVIKSHEYMVPKSSDSLQWKWNLPWYTIWYVVKFRILTTHRWMVQKTWSLSTYKCYRITRICEMKFQINLCTYSTHNQYIGHNLSKLPQHMYNNQSRMMYPIFMVGSFYHHGKYMDMKRWYLKIYMTHLSK